MVFKHFTDNCELIYHHSNYYTPGAEGGIRYNDPAVNIIWPLPVTEISTEINHHPYLTENFKGIIIMQCRFCKTELNMYLLTW